MITKISNWIIDQGKQHGATFVILAAVFVYAEWRNTKLVSKLDLCNQAIVQSYVEKQGYLIEVIKENTEVLYLIKEDLRK